MKIIYGVCDVIGLGVFSRGLASETTIDPQNARIHTLGRPNTVSSEFGKPKTLQANP